MTATTQPKPGLVLTSMQKKREYQDEIQLRANAPILFCRPYLKRLQLSDERSLAVRLPKRDFTISNTVTKATAMIKAGNSNGNRL